MKFIGKSIKYGDNVDTDVIIPARYLNTSDKKELAAHCMEDLDKNFNDIEDDVTTAVEKAKTLSEMGDIKVVKLRGCSVIYNHTTKITKSGANLIEIYRYNLNNNFFSSSTI